MYNVISTESLGSCLNGRLFLFQVAITLTKSLTTCILLLPILQVGLTTEQGKNFSKDRNLTNRRQAPCQTGFVVVTSKTLRRFNELESACKMFFSSLSQVVLAC